MEEGVNLLPQSHVPWIHTCACGSQQVWFSFTLRAFCRFGVVTDGVDGTQGAARLDPNGHPGSHPRKQRPKRAADCQGNVPLIQGGRWAEATQGLSVAKVEVEALRRQRFCP